MRTRLIFALYPNAATIKSLQEYANANNLDTKTPFSKDVPFSFHCTLVTSKNEIDIANSKTKAILSRDIKVYPEKMICLGNTKPIPCIKLSDDDRAIEGIRFMVLRQYKLIDTYDNYIPHVSMSYSGALTKEQIEALPLPTFPIVFDSIESDAVKDEESAVAKIASFISKIF